MPPAAAKTPQSSDRTSLAGRKRVNMVVSEGSAATGKLPPIM
jgi:hypothetical protein